jgi:hypothetical protein
MLIASIKSLIATVSTGLMFAAGGAAHAADPGISEGTITLACPRPFSGPNGAYGKEMKEGAMAYFAQLNASGRHPRQEGGTRLPWMMAMKRKRRLPTPAS